MLTCSIAIEVAIILPSMKGAPEQWNNESPTAGLDLSDFHGAKSRCCFFFQEFPSTQTGW
jgi:hypothetical protein